MNKIILVSLSMLIGALQSAAPSVQQIDLAERLASGKIKVVNREISAGRAGSVHLSARPDVGIAWIDGTDFSEGAIELDVRGKDIFQQSFLGIAFHRKDDTTYESVYVRRSISVQPTRRATTTRCNT